MAQCDMCDGSGKVEIMVHEDGSPVMFTTSSRANRSIEKGAGTASVPCDTCKGTGILPFYLEPSYWQGRLDEADNNLDRGLFGLGKYIRKALK